MFHMHFESSIFLFAEYNALNMSIMSNLLIISVYKFSWSVVSDSLWPHGLYVAHQVRLSMEFSGQDYWSG